MKVVILAGGYGTRIGEEAEVKPKPMVEIGGRPILWHIMKIYSSYGFNEFIVCLGHKGYVIKEYFANYFLHESNVTFDFTQGDKMIVHNNTAEAWKVTLVDTGLKTMTGGRIKRLKPYIGKETFMLTYGDGLADVDIDALLAYHKKNKKIATVTAARAIGRFGALSLTKGDKVKKFQEKTEGENSWINAGFFVLGPEVFDYIKSDATLFEQEPLEYLAKDGQLVAYKHNAFWQPMDTAREKRILENLWQSGKAPWKVWR